MPDEVESLALDISLINRTESDFNDIIQGLLEIEAAEEKVDPIDVDASIADAIVKLEALDSELDRLDRKDVDVDVDVGPERDFDSMQEMWRAMGQHTFEGDAERDLQWRRASDERLWQLMGMQTGEPLHGSPWDPDSLRLFGPTEHSRDAPLTDIDTGGRTPTIEQERRDLFGATGMFAQSLDDALLGSGSVLPEVGGDRPSRRDAISNLLDLQLSMGMIMNLFASLMPLLAVFVGALPALIAGLGALTVAAFAAAATLGGVAALGLGGMMMQGGEFNVEELWMELRKTLNTFTESIGPIMESLQPLMEQGFIQLRGLLRELGTRARVLLSLTDEVGGAMDFLAQSIGPALEEMVRFSEAAMPAVDWLVGAFASTDWWGVIAVALAQSLELVTLFGKLVVDMLPGLFGMSRGFLVMATALTVLISGFFQFIDIIPFAAEGLGFLISTLLTAITVSALYTLAQGRLATALLTNTAILVGDYVVALYTVTSAEYGAVVATLALAGAVLLLATVTGLVIIPMLGVMTSELGLMNNELSKATGNMRRFANQQNRVSQFSGTMPGPGGQGPRYGSAGDNITVVAPDQETGTSLANSMRFKSSDTEGDGGPNDRQHGSDG